MRFWPTKKALLEDKQLYNIMVCLVNEKIVRLENAIKEIDRNVFMKTNMRAPEFLKPGSPEHELANSILAR